MELIVTTEAARTMLMIRKDELYSMLESGEIPAFKIGNAWKIPKSTLEKFVVERANEEARLRRLAAKGGTEDDEVN